MYYLNGASTHACIFDCSLPVHISNTMKKTFFSQISLVTVFKTFISSILSLLFCRNLQKLILYGDTCVLQQEGLLDSSNLHQIHQGDKKINE